MSVSRFSVPALVLSAILAMVAVDMAEARTGGGRSFGSRGSKTFTAPPATNTAPRAAPVERSTTQPGQPATAAQRPGVANQGVAQTSRFGGWRGILMGGLFAAALASIFGFGALASVLGFLLQVLLIAALVYLLMSWWRGRQQPALARAPAQGGGGRPQTEAFQRAGYGMSGGGAAPSALTIGQSDLDSFERLLGEIQSAYSREDADALAERTTPEMLSYLLGEIAENKRNGVRNDISGVKLLQGDVSEGWREGGSDYATVAIRYALTDAMVDRQSGAVVSGDPHRLTEATEFWTFRRDGRDGWQLSAIQQTA